MSTILLQIHYHSEAGRVSRSLSLSLSFRVLVCQEYIEVATRFLAEPCEKENPDLAAKGQRVLKWLSAVCLRRQMWLETIAEGGAMDPHRVAAISRQAGAAMLLQQEFLWEAGWVPWLGGLLSILVGE